MFLVAPLKQHHSPFIVTVAPLVPSGRSSDLENKLILDGTIIVPRYDGAGFHIKFEMINYLFYSRPTETRKGKPQRTAVHLSSLGTT